MRVKNVLARALDVAGAPLTLAASLWMRGARQAGLQRQPVSAAIFRGVGVYPLRDHYYDPQFVFRDDPWEGPRTLPAVELDVDRQLGWLRQLSFQEELRAFPRDKTEALEFYYDNPSFGPGDAECLYSLLRLTKPRRMVEVGSGYSTLMAQAALVRNEAEGAPCEHTCIEPYEMPWLEKLPVRVVRERVERTDLSMFEALEPGDVLFIDSSHVIRPGGDVLHEFLHVLPRLKPGVFVHVHDIFTPRHYPAEWARDRFVLWNEQYLLEAFLSFNRAFETVLALNHLWHERREEVARAFPVLASEPHREPGSFWMRRAAAD